MHTVLHSLSTVLSKNYSAQEASALARLLLSDGLGWKPMLIYTGKDSDLSAEERNKIQVFLQRLMRFEPIQYILGNTMFCGRTFRVAPGVLIPRPETENLVQEILLDWKEVLSPSVLDLGTGSGCIAITLFLEMNCAKVDAWDISPEALTVARGNNSLYNSGVRFMERDVFEDQTDACAPSGYDVIVSNPPYIRESERKDMDRNVLDWEPGLALFVSDADPLIYYRRICELGYSQLKPGGMIYFEINSQFSEELTAMMSRFRYKDIQIKKDLFGKDRIIKGKR